MYTFRGWEKKGYPSKGHHRGEERARARATQKELEKPAMAHFVSSF